MMQRVSGTTATTHGDLRALILVAITT